MALTPKVPSTYVSIRLNNDEKVREYTLRKGYERFKQSDAKSMTLTSAGFSVIIVKQKRGYKVFFKDWKAGDNTETGSGAGKEEIEKGVKKLLNSLEDNDD